jgi:hypothetical protein
MPEHASQRSTIVCRAAGCAAFALAMSAVLLPAQTPGPPDASADSALHEYERACARDHGRLWGRSLCGPLILVDAATRRAVATDSPPGGTFVRRADVHVGRAPDDIPLANTSFEWAGRSWAIVRLPLPPDRFDRTALLIHESFHRIQAALGLSGPDLLSPHLDQRDGRYWLRLELHALAEALQREGAPALGATRDALLFRAARTARFPGADTLEAALEQQEGLAEYTGEKLALAETGAGTGRVALNLERFERRPSFVRSVGYATGPALGLLLDRYAPGWRRQAGREPMASALARAVRFRPAADPEARAEARATRYRGGKIAAEEDAREHERAARLAGARAALVDGPVLLLRQEQLDRVFDPNALFPLGGAGTVYPSGSFAASWGRLEVTEAGPGALVSSDFTSLTVAAPSDTSLFPLRGPGWTLRPAPGWRLAAGPRPGDLLLQPPASH